MPNPDSGSLLAALRLSSRIQDDLVARMSEPSRHYHGMDHLCLLWQRHLRFAPQSPVDLARFERCIALSIAFHDSVYVGGAKDNEELSAALWLDVGGADVGPADARWVADTILATTDHVTTGATLDLRNPSDYARQWVLDLDLTPLGEEPAVFDQNMALLRAEDPNVNLIAAIRHYASTIRLYRCAPIAAAFEKKARANFARHLTYDQTEACISVANGPV